MAKSRNKRGGQISAWGRSDAFREIGRAAITAFNQRRHLMPKCGAKTKGTGDPCQNIAKQNGRCWLHGGRTPKADQWHVRQLPTGGSSKMAMRKMDLKLARAEKDAKAKRQRLRLASEEERAAHDKWLWSHPPGSEKRRAARRLDQRIRRQEELLPKVAEIMVGNEETQAMMERIADLKARRAELETFLTGVFS